MDTDKKDLSPAPVTEAQSESQAEPVLRDDQGRRLFDENGEPIHWATPSQRVIAWVLALIVIAITFAFAYSLATGDLIHR